MQDIALTTRSTHPWVAEAQHTLRFGIVGGHLREWSQTVEFVQQAEQLGFDSFWANDHPTRQMDCWTTLAALASVTSKIRLVSLVSCIYYHAPTMVARMAADVDRMSGGRLVLGLGIGDDTQEFDQLALRFPGARERQEALEEAVALIYGLWDSAPFSFHGKYFHVSEARISPPPIQQPRVPLLIAGGGERVTLRQVAHYADMSNFGSHEWAGNAFELEDVQRKYAILRRYCEAEGRPYESILRSHYSPLLVLAETSAALRAKVANIPTNSRERYTPFFGTPDQAIAHFQALIDAGAQYFLAVLRGNDVETARLLAEEVRPALRPA